MTTTGTTAAHTIESDRLQLRELSAAEAAQVIDGTPPGGQCWAATYPLEGTLVAAGALVRAAEAGRYRTGYGMYQIIDRESGLVVGDIGFHGAPDDDGIAEIGYGIVPEFRGRGLVSEALRALAAWTFTRPETVELIAGTDPEHTPSQRVLTSAGFSFAGMRDEERLYRMSRPAPTEDRAAV